MKKVLFRILLVVAIIGVLIACVFIFGEDMFMNECLELTAPKFMHREKIELSYKDFFTNESVTKIYLSKSKTKRMVKKIKKNPNWKHGEIDSNLKNELESHTCENIYYNIPEIKDKYWIFTNRSNGVSDHHSIEELISDEYGYYAISVGILDVENNKLYYYEYDR